MELKEKDDLINECAKRIVNGNSHAYLIVGEDEEVCKKIVEKSILENECESEIIKPCLSCENCQKIMSKNAVDIHVYDEKNFNVEASAEIIEKMQILPLELKYNYFVLCNFSNATPQAQNKLLKSIEEPNAHTKFFIISKSDDNILMTIKSRTQIIYLPKIFDVNRELYDYAKFVFINLFKTSQILHFSQEFIQKKIEILPFLEHLTFFLKRLIYGDEECNGVKYSYEFISNVNLSINSAFEKLKSNISENLVYEELLFDIVKEKYNDRKNNKG